MANARYKTARVGGVDLAASPRRASATAVIDTGRSIRIYSAHSDEEIIQSIISTSVVAIDAPLALPPRGESYREVERAVIAMGYRLLPLTMKSMRALALRAHGLVARLREKGVSVVETHPRSALRSSGCRDVWELVEREGLVLAKTRLSRDERDAVVAAVAALHYSMGRARCVIRVDGEICLLGRIC